MRPMYRPEPALPAHARKTYHIARPLRVNPDGTLAAGSHWRNATCQEADCEAWRKGWRTVVDVERKLGRQQAGYIRMHSGRAFTVSQAGTLVTFTFPAGQRCFAQHRVPVGREPVFGVVDGDFRGNPRGTAPVAFRDHRDFLDDFGEHQQRLADRQQRG